MRQLLNMVYMSYVHKVENRITFKIKIGSYLELLTPKTVKLLGSAKSKINQDQKWRKCTSFRNYYQPIVILSTTIISKIKESFIHLFLKINWSILEIEDKTNITLVIN